MSDPRFKNGIHKSTTRRPSLQLDSPIGYGWQKAGLSDTTGYTLYSLGAAQMRCTTPQERFTTGHDYLIAIGSRVWSAPGDLAGITAEVKEILEQITPRSET